MVSGDFGGVTRNAVIGKVHRLGLSGRATTSRMKISGRATAPRPGGTNALQKRPVNSNANKQRFAQSGNPAVRALYIPEIEPFIPSAEELDIPMAERKTIQTLGECSCRWPIGDPQLAEFHFCGKNKVPGLPYCEFHARRAFQPPQARRRDREIVERVPAIAAADSTKETAGA